MVRGFFFTGRPCSLGEWSGVDADFSLKEKVGDQRKLKRSLNTNFETEYKSGSFNDADYNYNADDESEVEIGDNKDSDYSPVQRNVTECEPKPKKKKVMSQTLASAADWAQLSDRKLTGIIASTLSSAGLDVQNVTLSRSTVRRERMQNRESVACAVKESVKQADVPLSLHWDGKIVPDFNSSTKVDRLPVLVVPMDSTAQEQLLGIPKVARGNAKEETDGITKLIQEWGLLKRYGHVYTFFIVYRYRGGNHLGSFVVFLIPFLGISRLFRIISGYFAIFWTI